MSVKIQIIIAVLIICALIVIIDMIRKKRLELSYALSWLLVGIGVLILDIFPQLIKTISEKIGIVSPVNMLFFFGFCFSLIIIFVLTIAVSKLSIKIKQLAQQIAIYEKKEKGSAKIPFSKYYDTRQPHNLKNVMGCYILIEKV